VDQWIRHIAIVFFVLASIEGVSQVTVMGPSICLMHTTDQEQAAYDYKKDDCPAFTMGTLILLGRLDHFFESHDKSIVAGFTIVLAISTIGLWLSTAALQRTTNALWVAGERQLEMTLMSAEAAQKSAEIAERAFSHSRSPAFAFFSKAGFQNIAAGQHPSLEVSFKNIGRGDAHDVNYVMHADVFPIERLSEPFKVANLSLQTS
jgi:hypothetical protein